MRYIVDVHIYSGPGHGQLVTSSDFEGQPSLVTLENYLNESLSPGSYDIRVAVMVDYIKRHLYCYVKEVAERVEIPD